MLLFVYFTLGAVYKVKAVFIMIRDRTVKNQIYFSSYEYPKKKIQSEEEGKTLEEINRMELKEKQVLYYSSFKTLVQGC